MEAATLRLNLASRLRVLGQAFLSREQAPDARAGSEFQRLFQGPEAACPPRQSIFQAAPGQTAKKTSAISNKAVTWFRRFGFPEMAETPDPDHAGRLIFFAGCLIEADPSPAMLQAFGAEHLQWVPEFCDRVAAQSRHPFYSELAVSTKTAVNGFLKGA
jgi:TorA maturation chaperone TorD